MTTPGNPRLRLALGIAILLAIWSGKVVNEWLAWRDELLATCRESRERLGYALASLDRGIEVADSAEARLLRLAHSSSSFLEIDHTGDVELSLRRALTSDVLAAGAVLDSLRVTRSTSKPVTHLSAEIGVRTDHPALVALLVALEHPARPYVLRRVSIRSGTTTHPMLASFVIDALTLEVRSQNDGRVIP